MAPTIQHVASRSSPISMSSSDSASSPDPVVITNADLEQILATRSHELTNMFNDIDSRMARLEGKISKNNTHIEETNARIDETNSCVSRGFTKTDARLDDILALIQNGRSYRPFDLVYPRPLLDTMSIPFKALPMTVAKLWSMRKPELHQQLAAWIKAYKIDEWRYWRRDLLFADCDSYEVEVLDYFDADEAQEYADLTEAISRHPDTAVEVLACYLGCDVEKINGLVQRNTARSREKKAVKRQNDHPSRAESEKHPKMQERQQRQKQQHSPNSSTPSAVLKWDANMIPSERPANVFEDAPDLRPLASSRSPINSLTVPPLPALPSRGSTTIPDEERTS